MGRDSTRYREDNHGYFLRKPSSNRSSLGSRIGNIPNSSPGFRVTQLTLEFLANFTRQCSIVQPSIGSARRLSLNVSSLQSSVNSQWRQSFWIGWLMLSVYRKVSSPQAMAGASSRDLLLKPWLLSWLLLEIVTSPPSNLQKQTLSGENSLFSAPIKLIPAPRKQQ